MSAIMKREANHKNRIFCGTRDLRKLNHPLAISIMLVRPARSLWGLLGDRWLTRIDETGLIP